MGRLPAVPGMAIGGWIGCTVGARFGFFAGLTPGVVGTEIGHCVARRVANGQF